MLRSAAMIAGRQPAHRKQQTRQPGRCAADHPEPRWILSRRSELLNTGHPRTVEEEIGAARPH
jgi:hypothetical protein